MDLIKRLLKIGVGVALAAVLINDIGRFAQAQYTAGNVAREAAEISAQEAKRNGMDREASWRAGEARAQQAGATIYGYDLKNERAYVWLRMPVQNTFVLQPALSLIESHNTTTPLLVEDENQALIQ